MNDKKVKDGDTFWMVWREGGQRPRFRHGSESAATAEAERVARKHPGARTYVVQAISCVIVPLSPLEAVWTDCENQPEWEVPDELRTSDLVPITKTEIEKELPL